MFRLATTITYLRVTASQYKGKYLCRYVTENLTLCRINFYRTQVNLGSDLWVRMSVSLRRFADLTDVTLAYDNASGAIWWPYLQLMQVTE